MSSELLSRCRVRVASVVADVCGARLRSVALLATFSVLVAQQAAAQSALPTTLFDAGGWTWDIQGNGSISNGTVDAYDGGHIFQEGSTYTNAFGSFTTAATEDGGRELSIGPTTFAGVVDVTRKVYVPTTDQFVRYLDVFTNLTASAQFIQVRIYTNLGSDGTENFKSTSSGDTVFSTADYWVVTDDNEGAGVGDPTVVHVYGDGSLASAGALLSPGAVQYDYNVSVPASGQAILMHFGAQRWTGAAGVSIAQSLASLTGNALSGMTAGEISLVANFNAVPPPNSTPVANAQSVTTGESTSVAITVTASDADGDALTYTLASSPTNGGLTGTLPTVTYNPNASYFGSDSFSFYVNDGTVNSSTATVSITVNATPVPDAQAFSMISDTSTAVTLTAADNELDAITYTVVATPTSGTLTGTEPDLTYTPNAGFTGTDSLTFTVSDAYTTSAVTSVDITVVAPVVLSGVDLLNNGGFEDGSTSQWTLVSGSFPVSTGEGGVVAFEGTYYGDMGGATFEAYQDVDVRGYASQVAAGTMTVGISGYIRSKSEALPDKAGIIVEYRDSTNSSVLESYNSGLIQNTGAWLQLTDVRTPHVDTGYVRVRLIGDRRGTNMDAFIDDVQLLADGVAEVAVFDGIDDYIAVPDNGAMTMTNEVTLEAWVYPTGPGSDATYGGVILSKEGEYQLGRGPTGELWAVLANTSPGWTVIGTGYTIPEDGWSHVAVTYEAIFGAIEFYVNGAPVYSSVGSGVITDVDATNNTLYIGGRGDGSEAFDGHIDEPRVWSIERPAAHMANTYQKQHDGDETGLAGYWTLDGAVLTDATANGNDGIASGATASIGYPLGFVSNSAPVLSGVATQATNAGVSVTVALSATDADGDSVTVDVITEPTGATVSVDDVAGTVTYLPLLGTAGTQTFQVAANDGIALSNVITVTVDVTAADFAPAVGGLVELVRDDFQSGVTGSWTNASTTTAPADGSRGFLGQFGNGTVSLPIAGIPSHTEVTISFDLYLLNSWDGNGGAGPDLISVSADGASLLLATFSNVTNGSDNGFQSFPGTYPGPSYVARTGATEAGTLGGTFYGDSVYEFTYTFPHTASTLQFDFSASGLEDIGNESWGLDNVVVSTQHLNMEEDVVTEFTLPGSDAGGEALTYTVTTAPSTGSISVTGSTATYTPATDFNGTATFGYTVADATTTTPESTITILIDPLDSAPVFDTISDVTVDEDSGVATVTITGIGPGGLGDEDSQTVSMQATSFSPTLIPSPTLALSGSTATLTFTPAADAAGAVSVLVAATDTGLDVASGGPSGGVHHNSASQVFTVNLTALNDAPSFDAIADVTMDEDATPAPISITTVSAGGGADEATQTVTFTATSSDATIVPDPVFSGTGDTRVLTFAPVTDANGTVTITVTATDDGATDGVTQFNSATDSFTITIDPVNDAPGFDTIATQSFDEDGGPVDVTITGVQNGGGTDEAAQILTFTATSSQPTVVPNPTITGSGTTRTLSLDSVADANGAATITVTVTDDGGALGGLDVDTYTQTFTVVVSGVNDPPVFDAINPVAVDEDAGVSTVSFTGISPGGGTDEASQSVIFTATSSDTAIVPNPSVSTSAGTGTVIYSPVAEANGTVTITLTGADTGSGTAPSVNSVTQTFDITVNAVNDAPSFDPVADQSVDEDSGAASVAITNVAVGGGSDESSSQTASVTATSSDPSIVPDPTVSGSGATWALTYAPVADEAGLVTITVVVDDGGPTAGPGDIATATRTFPITVNGINDAPTIATLTDLTIEEDAGLTTVFLGQIGPGGGADEAGQGLTFSTASFNPLLISSVSVSASEVGYDLVLSPVADANGVATVLVSVLDDGSSVSPNVNQTQQSFDVTVTAVDDAPSFDLIPDVTASEDSDAVSVLITTVSAGPSDESATQTVTLSATSSDVALIPDPTLTGSGDTWTLLFQPVAAASGSATITVAAVDDGSGVSPHTNTYSQNFLVTVVPVNDSATADPTTALTDEDVPVSISLTGSDLDGDVLSFLLWDGQGGVLTDVSSLNGGAVSLSDVDAQDNAATAVYTPPADFNGTDTFQFIVNDGIADSATAAVTVTVAAQPDAPVATAATATTSEDTATTVTLGGIDADGDAVTVLLWDGAAGVATDIASLNGGTVSIGATAADAATATYTPPADYAGADSFEFVVNDGVSDSAVVTVSITVDPINDAPTLDATADQTVAEDSAATTIPLTGLTAGGGVDEDTQAVAVSVASSDTSVVPTPTLTEVDAGVYDLTFQPAADAVGSATITLTAQDDGGSLSPNVDYATRTFVVTVTAVNDDPSFDPIAAQVVDEDSLGTTVTVTGVTPGGGVDEASQVVALAATSSDPSIVGHPTVTEAGGVYTLAYQPETDANGSVTVTVDATDDGGALVVNAAAFTIAVNAVNDAPAFDPVAGQTSLDDAGTVAVGITGVTPGGGLDEAGQVVTLTATSSDPSIVSDPTVTEAGGVYTLLYDVTLGITGSVTITVVASDDGGSTGIIETTSSSFLVTVSSSNAAPVADPTAVATDEDIPVDIVLTATDVDGDALAFSLWDGVGAASLTTALGATVTLADADPTDATATATYTPAADANGVDTFDFLVNDGSVDSALATVTVTVNAVNDNPVFDAVPDQTVAEDAGDTVVTVTGVGAGGGGDEAAQAVTLTATSSDPTVVPDPAITGSTPSLALTFAPVANASGSADVTLTATDDAGGFLTRTFTITVEPVGDAPTADDVAVTTNEDTAVAVGLSGADGDGDVLTFSLHDGVSTVAGTLTTAGGGSVTLSGVTATYTPAADYNGIDFFTYVANDGLTDSVTATVTVTVDAVNDAPTFDAPNDVTMDEDSGQFTVTIAGATVGGGDDEGAMQSVSLSAASDAPALVADPVVSGSGTTWTLTMQPAAEANGVATITVTATDGGDSVAPSVSTATATFIVTVNAVNDGPSFDFISDVTLVEDGAATDITVTGVTPGGGDDEAAQGLFFTATSSNAGILLDPLVTGSGATRTLTLEPQPDGVGSVTVTVTVVDDGGVAGSGQDTYAQDFLVTVSGVNDVPVAAAQAVATDEDAAVAITITATDPDMDDLTYSLFDGSSQVSSLTTVNGATVAFAAAAAAETYLEQWAATVLGFSTEYSTGSWSAAQTLGAPYTFGYGDISTAWTSENYNGTTEFLLLGFDTPVYADGALIRETYGNGMVFQIDVMDTSGSLQTVWSGFDPSPAGAPYDFMPTWSRTAYLVSGLKIWVDTDHDPDAWEEIDAVQLLGSPDTPGSATASVVYTPAAEFTGVDTFQFVVGDGVSVSDPATVTVTVGSLNDAPSFDAIADVSTDEDSGDVVVTVTGISAGGGADESAQTVTLTAVADDASVVGAPSITQTGSTADITLTPVADASGTVTITVTATDSGDATAPNVNTYSADFALTVNPVNDAPVGTTPTGAYNATEGQTVDIPVTGTDVDSTAVTFALWDGATTVDTLTTGNFGSVTLADADAKDNTATATYTPPSGFDGSDTFEFVPYDGTDYGAATTVTVVVGSLPRLTIADVTVAEGDAGTAPADFIVTLSAVSDEAVTVTYGTAADTAVDGADYTAAFGTLTFDPGSLSQVASVTVHGDTTYEGDDTFYVDLSLPVGAVIEDAQGVATITNDDPLPTIDITDVGATEGAPATVTFTMSNASDSAATVDYSTADGTAGGADYTTASGTLTFDAGATAQTLDIAVADDSVNEADETFTVDLAAPAGASVGQATATVTIADDDDVVVSVADVTVTEDDATSPSAVFDVTLSGASEQDITVDYATSDAEAIAGADYTATVGTLVISAGTTAATVEVAVLSDDVNENTETFVLTLSNVTARGVTLGNDLATGSIVDDDSLTIDAVDAEVAEADTADVTLVFPVTLSRASDSAVTVDYALTDGATNSADLTADIVGSTSGTVSFAAGETTSDILVQVAGDAVNEANETVTLTLSNPTGPSATLSADTFTGTILDNDDIVLSVSAASVAEAVGTFTFDVQLSGESEQTVTVDYATTDGAAVAPEDYTAASGTVTVLPGESTGSLSIVVVDDAVHELDETFTVTLTNATGRGVTADAAGVDITITNDDPVPSLSVGDVTVTESDGAATLVVSLSGETSAAVTVGYATANAGATAGADYSSTSGTLTIAAGATSADVVITVLDDTTPESDETFILSLRNATNATVTDGQALITILDDDEPPTIAILTPADGDSYASGTASVEISVEVAHHADTWRWKLGADFDASNPFDGNLVASGATATADGLIDGQAYRVYVALADASGALLDPPIGASAVFGVGREVHPDAREFVYDLPAGSSLFSLTLDPLFLTNGTDTINVADAAGGPLASHLVQMGASVVTRALNGGAFASAIGRDGVIVFGSDFSVAPGSAYIVNMPVATSFTLEGLPYGSAVVDTLLTAPDANPVEDAPWLFAVGVEIAEGTTLPDDVRLRIWNSRTGDDVVATRSADGRYGVTSVDEARDGVAREGDTLGFELVTREGYRLDVRDTRRVTRADSAYASKVVRIDARPATTALLPNYPNPFNPETWIPFTLTAASEATIRIYDVQGAVVRTLRLGRRPAGHHVARVDAARWDGRNAVGEAVSSGVYFYELDANGERAMRQMVIRK